MKILQGTAECWDEGSGCWMLMADADRKLVLPEQMVDLWWRFLYLDGRSHLLTGACRALGSRWAQKGLSDSSGKHHKFPTCVPSNDTKNAVLFVDQACLSHWPKLGYEILAKWDEPPKYKSVLLGWIPCFYALNNQVFHSSVSHTFGKSLCNGWVGGDWWLCFKAFA